MPTVDVTKIAIALNLDQRRVQQLVKEGMPRAARGRYDRMKCTRWYIRYLTKVLERKSVDVGYIGERRHRVRLMRAVAGLREMELAKQRSSLVSLPDVEAAFADLVRTVTARVMAIAPQVAPELVGETSRVMIQAKIEKASKEALVRMENHKH